MLFAYARRRELLIEKVPDDVFRWGAAMALSPDVFFILSIPVAFLASSSLAVAVWALGIPAGILSERWKPEHADDFLIS